MDGRMDDSSNVLLLYWVYANIAPLAIELRDVMSVIDLSNTEYHIMNYYA